MRPTIDKGIFCTKGSKQSHQACTRFLKHLFCQANSPRYGPCSCLRGKDLRGLGFRGFGFMGFGLTMLVSFMKGNILVSVQLVNDTDTRLLQVPP